tara:strand:+ start:259 stop:1590 length:1332 start_codon:yes stop_codon:yes gene_type:complete
MVNIIPTIGPSCCDKKNLEFLIKNSRILRFNGSHNTLEWHKKHMILAKKINKHIVILFDIPGIKMRTLNKSNIEIEEGKRYFFYDFNKKKINGIPVSNYFLKKNEKFTKISLSDGKYLFNNIKIANGYFSGVSQESFILESKKGVNIPNYKYDDLIQTRLYEDFIKKIKYLPFDAIGLSYIQSIETLQTLKKKLKNKIIVSKIENSQGLKNTEEICQNSNGIMIDRGDLVAEIGQSNLFKSINKITNIAKKNGNFLIMATENLESLIISNQPTKSEIVSLSHSLFIGMDSIMLSNETAINKNWKRTFNWLKKFIIDSKNKKATKKDLGFFDSVFDFNGIPTVIFSKYGYGVKEFKKNFNTFIYCITDQILTQNELVFFSNIKTSLENYKFSKKNYDYIKKSTIKVYKKYNLNSKYIRVIWIAFPRSLSRLNSITLFKRDDLFN